MNVKKLLYRVGFFFFFFLLCFGNLKIFILELVMDLFFQDDQSELINEVLKVLYNLVLHIDKNSPDEEEDSHCLRLISILRSLLLASSRCPEKTDALHR